MGNHPFNVIVIVFWLATMSWLVVAKILPPMRVGEPPSYTTILKESTEQPPVCWSIRLQGETVGWAATKITRRRDAITDLYSRVYLGDFPLDQIAPGWLGTVLKPVLGDLAKMDIDKKSQFVIDPLGRLVRFESRVSVADLADVIKVQGQVEGTALKLSVQSGDLPPYKTEKYLPHDALMGDELSPQARMPGLRVGQSWTVPIHSPFLPQDTPLEILQALVEREDQLTWGGENVKCRVIVYRADAGSSLSSGEPRGRAWVNREGVVLQQEVSIFRTQLRFVRLPDDRAKAVWAALGDDWTGRLSRRLSRQILRTVRSESP